MKTNFFLTCIFIILTVGSFCCFFFFNDPAPTEIYPLSLHDALPISPAHAARQGRVPDPARASARSIRRRRAARHTTDRKSTRLNSSHSQISYAVFCLKKKKK